MIGLCQMGFAQSSEDIKNRVVTIKKWYGEIQSIGLKNCVEKTYIEKEILDKETKESENHKQTIKKCILNSEYEVIQGEFSRRWSYAKTCIYKKNGKVFFVFIDGNGDGYPYQSRYYFDSNERLIKKLLKETDFNDKTTNKEIITDLGKGVLLVFKDDDDFSQIYNFEFRKNKNE